MTDFLIRRGGLAELDVLVRHRRRMWEDIGEADAALLDGADEPYRRWLEAQFAQKAMVAFVAEHPVDGVVASGCVWLQPVQPRPQQPSTTQPYLMSMFTEPAHRGKGVAEAIVRVAMDWVREEGHGRMSLHAAPMGRRLYERLGFERTWEMRRSVP